jgi:integrase
MATIIKRGDRFLARVRRQGFAPVSRTFIRRSDAIAWGRKVEADMQAGRWVEEPREVPMLSEALKTYRKRVAVNLKGARDYAYSFRELEASPLAQRKLDGIMPADLADWRDALLSRGLKNATVCRRLGLLSGVLTWCHKERGWIDSNPMRAVSKPTVRDQRTRTLDAEEVRYLIMATKAARAVWLHDAVTVLIRSAMRRSELVALRCADVDLDRSVATLRDTKNGETRDCPLCPEARDALGRLLAAAKAAKADRVLPINDPEAVSFAFRRAVVRGQERYAEDCSLAEREPLAGFLEGVRLHDLRHHAISDWARTGAMGLVDLMAISGHKSPRMLARYTHLNASDLAARMASLSAGDVAQRQAAGAAVGESVASAQQALAEVLAVGAVAVVAEGVQA